MAWRDYSHTYGISIDFGGRHHRHSAKTVLVQNIGYFRFPQHFNRGRNAVPYGLNWNENQF